MMQLFIANKNYSSWSMRSWILLKAFDIPFDEQLTLYPAERTVGYFKKINVAGKVPVLLDEHLLIWDTLAIAEYLAEKFPEKYLWPNNFKLRSRARCISAEMHSGFQSLRDLCGMNIRASFKNIGAQLWKNNPALREDIARIEQIWSERPDDNGFLCGDFSIADTFYAPVVTRIRTYGLPVNLSTQRYIDLMLKHPAVKAWIDAAVLESEKVNYYENYQED